MNSNVGPNFNEKVTQKWDLWVRALFMEPTELIKELKSQQFPASVHMNSSRCPLIECIAVGEKRRRKKGEEA